MSNKLFSLVSVIIVFLLSGACPVNATRTLIKADNPDISYMGRRVTSDEGKVRFNFPGFTAMVNFTGVSLDMLTNPGSGYWVVEVDSLPPVKKLVSSNDSILSVASGMPEGNHSARITYCIEGYEFRPEIRGFLLSDSGQILPKTEKNDLKIEFIGNSITCGYGTEAEGPQNPFSYDTENHCLGYAYLTARNLDADFNMVCRSGIGIYRNYDGPKEGSPDGTMTMEYGNALLYEKDEKWDFNKFIPDIVCINLGTNDTSTCNYDIELFEHNYADFVDRIRGYYPSAKIVLLTGSMLSNQELEDVKNVLDRIASSRKGVFRFDMSPQDGSLGYGADYHPSKAQARKMADELTSFLRNL